MNINKRLKQTMIYLLNFEEGDNITITSDFVNTIEQLNEDIITLLAIKRENNTMKDDLETIRNIINILIKERDFYE